MSLLNLALLASSLPIVVLGAQRRATSSSFQLYAYGDGLGGLPMFNADGFAYVGDPTLSNGTDAATVTFSPGTDSMWIGSPNTTDSGNSTAPDWSNVTFFIPPSTSTDGRIGFLDGSNSSSDAVTTGFDLYGSTAFWTGDDGQMETLWYALPVGDTGVHALYWNDTSSGQIPIALRTVAPSNPSDKLAKRRR